MAQSHDWHANPPPGRKPRWPADTLVEVEWAKGFVDKDVFRIDQLRWTRETYWRDGQEHDREYDVAQFRRA